MARLRRFLLLLLLPLFACCAASPPHQRPVTPLNEGWEMAVVPAALEAGLAKAVPPRAVSLPHAWGPALADAEAVEYTRPLVLPESIGPAGVLLVVQHAVGNLEIRVDGIRAAAATGNGLTRTVRLQGEAGSQHALTLRLSRAGMPEALRGACGLGPVYLEVLPAVRLDALLPETNAARGTVSVSYRASAEEPGPALLRLRLYPPDSTRALTERHFTLALTPGITTGNYTFTVRRFQPWSPESPRSYRLRATLQRGRTLYDTWVVPCGGSTLLSTAGGLRLNDSPLVLKGMRLPGGVPPRTNLRDELTLMKKAGFNAIMADGAALSEDALTLADQLGLLVVGEIPPGGDARPEIVATVEAQGTHPCLAAWSWADATGAMRDVLTLRTVDRIRPVLVRAGAKSQFFNPPPVLLGRLFTTVELPVLDGSDAAQATLAAAERSPVPLLAGALGGGEAEDGYQDRLRAVIESTRRAQAPIGYFVRPTRGAVLTGLGTEDGTPTDAFTSASLYNQPCAIALRAKPTTEPGQLAFDAAVINDLSLAGSLRLYLIITDPSGKTTLTNTTLTLNEQRIQPITTLTLFPAPERGTYKVHLVLVRNGTVLASSQTAVTK